MNRDDNFAFVMGIIVTIIIMLVSILWSYTIFRNRDIRQKNKEPYAIHVEGTDTTYIYRHK